MMQIMKDASQREQHGGCSCSAEDEQQQQAVSFVFIDRVVIMEPGRHFGDGCELRQ
jgi:hypothetical protein